jgi:uncharacterized surface protein with fasciclin (FAS1) repeats
MTNIYDTLKQNGNFNTLLRAIDTAGMEDDFKTGGEFTLFAPTDQAFSEVQKKQADSLMRDKRSAAELVRRHTMNGRSMSKGLKKSVTVLNGESTKIETREGLRFGEAMAVQPDIECDNGVVHVIDRVLIPQSAMIKA